MSTRKRKKELRKAEKALERFETEHAKEQTRYNQRLVRMKIIDKYERERNASSQNVQTESQSLQHGEQVQQSTHLAPSEEIEENTNLSSSEKAKESNDGIRYYEGNTVPNVDFNQEDPPEDSDVEMIDITNESTGKPETESLGSFVSVSDTPRDRKRRQREKTRQNLEKNLEGHESMAEKIRAKHAEIMGKVINQEDLTKSDKVFMDYAKAFKTQGKIEALDEFTVPKIKAWLEVWKNFEESNPLANPLDYIKGTVLEEMKLHFGNRKESWLRQLRNKVLRHQSRQKEVYMNSLRKLQFPTKGDLFQKVETFFGRAMNIMQDVNQTPHLFMKVCEVLLDKLPSNMSAGSERIKGLVLSGELENLMEVQQKVEAMAKILGGEDTVTSSSKNTVTFGSSGKNKGQKRKFSSTPKTKHCDICDKDGHSKYTCPTKGTCTICQKGGHSTSECRNKDTKCKVCKKIGHLTRNCPKSQNSASKVVMRKIEVDGTGSKEEVKKTLCFIRGSEKNFKEVPHCADTGATHNVVSQQLLLDSGLSFKEHEFTTHK